MRRREFITLLGGGGRVAARGARAAGGEAADHRALTIRAPPPAGIMTTSTTAVSTQREPELFGQTVVVIGGSAGIGLETARRARVEGASLILTGRNPERLEQAAREVDAQRTAAFDANDPASLQSFFQDLPTPIDHVMVTAGAPHYGPPLEMPPEEARRGLTEHLLLALEVARGAVDKVRPPGSLVFMGGTGARRPRAGLGIASTATVALELAPIRVNLIAAGFVDTPLSASILGEDLDSGATSSGRRCRSAASSDRLTSPP